jgi:hypothetical protein
VIFVVDEFHDLTLLSVEKLIKLRDRAAQHALESARQADEDKQRWVDITQELDKRGQ